MMGSYQRLHLIVMLIFFSFLLVGLPASAGTADLHVLKVTRDGRTVLNETNVSFPWMMANLPVYGDGATHYYMEGPVMNGSYPDKWDTSENYPEIQNKDFGAVKGTNLRDVCDLVGGMESGDYNVSLIAPDGFRKVFAYSSVYAPSPRSGPIVITWFRPDLGYVNQSYAEGMRNVMFADTSTNPWGLHVFGLWDMHETYPEWSWHYYEYPDLPSVTGLSVQNISIVKILSKYPTPIAGYSNPPTDPDHDGIYEDLNANGRKDFNDVFIFFKQMNWIGANEPVSLFDYNHNGRIDFNDIFVMFKEI
jgi:PKD repeat protein